MVYQDFNYIFDSLDIEGNGYIEWDALQEFDELIYQDGLDIEQLEAAIETVCGKSANGKCRREYFGEVAKELERRHLLEESTKWDFRALDVNSTGRIPVEAALFLAKAVHKYKFSLQNWKLFLNSRLDPYEDISYDEIKLFLCNMPEFASSHDDDEFLKQETDLSQKRYDRVHDMYEEYEKLQEDDSTIAAKEQQKYADAAKIKRSADNLLNRIDEIGIDALLEDEFEGDYEGRPKEKVTTSELIDALKEKYCVLRDRLLFEMLRIHMGEGMWQTLTEQEQREKLFQLRLKEEKLCRENKLQNTAMHLPGAQHSIEYNLLSLMGESKAEFQQRMKKQEQEADEKGIPIEDIEKIFESNFSKKIKESSTTDQVLLDLENRHLYEKDILYQNLQGFSGFKLMTTAEKENCLAGFVQCRLRGTLEKLFHSASTCIGLCERIIPVKQQQIKNDDKNQSILSANRLKAFKSRRFFDDPVIPPRLFQTKDRLGRIDILLLLVQESERRFALEREALFSFISSKDSLVLRKSASKLDEIERKAQLFILCAQWRGRQRKTQAEKLSTLKQNRRWLEEATALKLESLHFEFSNQYVDVSVELLKLLQVQQDKVAKNISNAGTLEKHELERCWKSQTSAIIEESLENIAIVVFGIIETTDEENELLDALNEKYDNLRDKLLMDALMKQLSQKEWDALSEQERQNRLARMKLLERKLRKEGKYDELAKLFGDSAKQSDLLNSMLGNERQKYLDKLNERLRNRQRRIEAGEDPDDIADDMIDEGGEKSSGNIFKDLDRRFEEERDALLKRMRDENDRNARERERQAELARLRLEARKANRESNFDSAALVLGLAERNNAALQDRLKNDRERQEKLARERIAARRKNGSKTESENEASIIEPSSDDLPGWQNFVLSELERKHNTELQFFLDLVQDESLLKLKDEGKEMSTDQRNERLNQLLMKRNRIDFQSKDGQEESYSLFEMAYALKFASRYTTSNLRQHDSGEKMNESNENIDIALTADLQQAQDEETRNLLPSLNGMTQVELKKLQSEIVQERIEKRNTCLAKTLFENEGKTSEDDLVKALDKKYDTLMDKLALEALKKQMGDAEWANLSEKERQRKMVKMRLEQKRLLKEGKLDEAARLLGESFKTHDDIKKLMGENKEKYNKMLQERLAARREKLKRGEEITEEDDLLNEDDNEIVDENKESDAKSLLADLQKRYDDEKDALLAKLHGADSKFMSERERQAELARLRREQRRAQQEEKFGAAAMVLGLAERNQKNVKEKLQNDRLRQEELAKQRLARLREKRKLIAQEDIKVEVDSEKPNEGLMKLVERRHIKEQEDLFGFLNGSLPEKEEDAKSFSVESKLTRLQKLCEEALSGDLYEEKIKEMVPLKFTNKEAFLVDKNRDDIIVSIMADLQQRQDEESSQILQYSIEKGTDEIMTLQAIEVSLLDSHKFPNIAYVLSSDDQKGTSIEDDTIVDALEAKYDLLTDKLIQDALEKKFGDAWNKMSEKERQEEIEKFKAHQKELESKGKTDEAEKELNDLLKDDAETLKNVKSSFEKEKEALLERLQNADSQFNMERKRQLELARLRREARRAQAEEKFDAAAMVLGMAKSQKDARDTQFANDRERQEKLARERLEARRKKRASQLAQIKEEDANQFDVTNETDGLALRDKLLQLVEKRHQSEREYLLNILNTYEKNEFYGKIITNNDEQNKTRLLQLQEQYKVMLENTNIDDLKNILTEAISIQGYLSKKKDEDKNIDNVIVQMLADLQEIQDKEGNNFTNDLENKDIETLKQLIESQVKILHHPTNNNVAKITFKSSTAEDDLVNALKEKYDAMKEKIFIEALKNKFGEDEWEKMSDHEKLEHLSKMKAGAETNNADDEGSLNSFDLPGMEKLVSKSRARQEQKFKDRMNSKKSIGQEMEKGGDVLKDIDSQFAAEKEALMAMLQNADNKEATERKRQLELARLRREKQRIKREEKYDGAALVLSLANKNVAKKEASYENERARQEELARQRLEARNRRLKELSEKNEKSGAVSNPEEILREEESKDRVDDNNAINDLQSNKKFVMHEMVLNELEKKHEGEQEVLLDLLQKCAEDVDTMKELSTLKHGELLERLSLMNVSRKKIKEQSRAFINSQPPENTMTENEKEKFLLGISNGRTSINKNLSDALKIILSMKKELLKDVDDEKKNEEATILIMADLQEKQAQESNAMLKALEEANDEMLMLLKNAERKARRAGWCENISKIVYDEYLRKAKITQNKQDMEKEIAEENNKLEKETKDKLQKLEEELAKEKEEKLKELNENEAAKYLEELKHREHNARKSIQEQMERQRSLAKARVEERRRQREQKEYEGDLAVAMIAGAQKRADLVREKTLAVQGAQKDSLEERLRHRREERERRKREEAERVAAVEEEEKTPETSKSSTETQDESIKEKGQDEATPQPAVVKKKRPNPPLPGGGMKREKTVVEKAAEIPENRKKEMMNMLMREQTSIAMKINKEQSRQEQMVRDLREKRRQKMQAREMEAEAILGLGARQKTMVEDKKKSERERQIDQIRERVNRIKNERTIAAQKKTDEDGDSRKFSSLAQEQPSNLTADEKMERIAQEMEKKFRKEEADREQRKPIEVAPLDPKDQEDNESTRKVSRGRMDEKMREQILKERQKSRKEQRRLSSMPPPVEDVGGENI